MANDNKEVGRFDLADIPPSPRGLPQIEVAFDIDADGILHVSAKDLSSGKEQKIRIEAQSGLKEDEIKKMLKDAELHAEEDKKRKEEIEVKNEADSLTFRAQKALDEYKSKLPQNVVDEITTKIEAIKKAIESNEISRIKSAKEDLEKSMQHIGEAMSKAQQAGQQQQTAGAGAGQQHHEQPHHESGGAKEPDEIEDADVEIIDDK